MDNQKTAVIYARVSTKDQDCQRQISDLQAYAVRAGYNVIEVFQEKASGAKNDRAERAKVIKLAQGRKIDVVLVTELSRWGRSTPDLLATMEDLRSRGVSIVALSGMQMDLSTPNGKLMATILAGVAEFEKALIQERVRSGIAQAKANGRQIGRAAGDNYKSAEHEEAIEQLMLQGKSCRAIATETKLGKTTVAEIMKRLRQQAA